MNVAYHLILIYSHIFIMFIFVLEYNLQTIYRSYLIMFLVRVHLFKI